MSPRRASPWPVVKPCHERLVTSPMPPSYIRDSRPLLPWGSRIGAALGEQRQRELAQGGGCESHLDGPALRDDAVVHGGDGPLESPDGLAERVLDIHPPRDPFHGQGGTAEPRPQASLDVLVGRLPGSDRRMVTPSGPWDVLVSSA